jgi:hypothetical protein
MPADTVTVRCQAPRCGQVHEQALRFAWRTSPAAAAYAQVPCCGACGSAEVELVFAREMLAPGAYVGEKIGRDR